MKLQRVRYFILISIAAILSAIDASAQTCVWPPSGLVSWWRGEGNASDQAGTNNGFLQGNVLFAPGQVGQAFNLNGSNAFISATASASLNVGAGNGMTIECWMKPSDLTSGHMIAEWNDGGANQGFQFWISVPEYGGVGSVFVNAVTTSGASQFIATSPNVLNTTTYQHVAFTFNRTNSGLAKIYLNGNIVATQNFAPTTLKTSYNFYIGNRVAGPGTGSYYKGQLDEVSLYDRALSDSEIQGIFNAGTAGKCFEGPPFILSQPTNQTVLIGQTADFSVSATGSQPLTYQWKFYDTNLLAATNSSLTLTNVQLNQAGTYFVVVSNSFGPVSSSNAVLMVVPPPPCTNPAPGIVSWWRGENNALDEIGGNNGTLQNGVTFGAGKVGQAFSFNGNSNTVKVLPSASMNVGQGSGFTIEAWIKPANVSIGLPIVEWAVPSNFGVHFWTFNNGALYANIVDVNGNHHIIQSQTGVLTNGGFQHVSVTYDKASGVSRLIVNGVMTTQSSLGTFTPRTSTDFYLAFRPSTSPSGPLHFIGLIDEPAIYNRALSTNEVKAIYNAGVSGKCVLPIAPSITVQPTDQTVRATTNVTFTAGVMGSPLLTNQWRFNGTNIPGATNLSLTISNVQTTDAGSYSLTVSNSVSSATSSNAVLKIIVVSAFGNSLPLTNAQHAFTNSVSITLQNAFSGGTTFYTLDGSTPSFASSQYTSPFVLTKNATLRAVGYSADFFQMGQLDPVSIIILPTYSLIVSNAGGGTVALNPTTGPYASNTVVTLTATPTAGWAFLQWQGDASGTNNPLGVTMNRKKYVRAIFGTSLSNTVAGSGSVTMSPPGGVYPFGTIVRFSAIPQLGNYFALWGNAAGGNTNPLYFAVTSANQSVSSLFAPLGGSQVALTVVPAGNGRITIAPRTNVFNIGNAVTITATPDSGQTFLSWSGDTNTLQNPLSLVMDQSKLIYANFTTNRMLVIRPGFDGMKETGFQFSILGDIGDHYQIEGSTNLLNWMMLGTVTNSFGTLQFIDSATTNIPYRFYRSLTLP